MTRPQVPMLLAGWTVMLVFGFGLGGVTASEPSGNASLALEAARRADGPSYYIIQLEDAALAQYRGGLGPLAPTSPTVTRARQLDVEDRASLAYLSYLDASQDTAVAAIERHLGRPVEVLHRYRLAYNGLAVWLGEGEAEQIAAIEGIVQVERNTIAQLDTDVSPAWIGASDVWGGIGLPGADGTLGEGVIVGMLDTGINIDHPSFAATGDDGYTHENPFGEGNYRGLCDPSHPAHQPRFRCNSKLVGVYGYPETGNNPEDANGHGSHTAGIAAGNVIHNAVLRAPTTTITRSISGMAPHANLIAFQVCSGGCAASATLAAIDQAIADGVDVLNYSVSMARRSPWVFSVSQAFLAAHEAGIVVGKGGGNDGPAAGTVHGNAPWITTAGVTTHPRAMQNALIATSGGDAEPPADLIGAGFTAALNETDIVLAEGHLRANGAPDNGMCLQPFPPGTWAGEIVVCDRGQVGRVVKGNNVRAGGAGGYVLVNLPGGPDNVAADSHSLPGVHLAAAEGERLRAWLGSGTGHRARISGVLVVESEAGADQMASFASRGPAGSTRCCRRGTTLDMDPEVLDFIKPDVAAPGVDILAPIQTSGNGTGPAEYGLKSGGSMAGPHVAGAAALLSALSPDWSPSQIQSALIQTAHSEGVGDDGGATHADPFDMGGGRIDVAAAAKVGLTLHSSVEDYEAANPAVGGTVASINAASLMHGACPAHCAWTRRVRSTRDEAVAWTLSVQSGFGQSEMPQGLAIDAEPRTFTIEPGKEQAVEIAVDTEGMALGAWAFAQLVLEPDDSTIPISRMPIAVRHVETHLPPAIVVYTDQRTGAHRQAGLVTPELSDLVIGVHGLVQGTRSAHPLSADPTNANPYDSAAGTSVTAVQVPTDTRRLVAEISTSESRNANLYVGIDRNADGLPQAAEQLCASTQAGSVELCDLVRPAAGAYWVMVHNFLAAAGAPNVVGLVTAVVGGEDVGNLELSGPSLQPRAEPFDIELRWDLPGAESGDRWFAAIDLHPAGPTSLSIGQISVDLIAEELAPPENGAIYLPLARYASMP